MKLTVKGNLVSPFPVVDYEDFGLLSDWFLPQDLPMLRALMKNPDLNWDFSSKSVEDRILYKDIFRNSYTGDLGLLFYRKPNGLWVDQLPDFWNKHKVLEKIEEAEAQQWEKAMKNIWEIFVKADNILWKEELKQGRRNRNGPIIPTDFKFAT